MSDPWKDKREIGNATLYLGDCLEILPTLPKVDHVITDPPYGARTHEGARTGAIGGEALIDFACIDDETFMRACAASLAVARRWVLMTCEWRHAARFEDSGLPLIRLGVWVKPNGAPQFTGDRPGTGWEAVAILHNPGKKRWNGGGSHAVWNFPKTEGLHPTIKPQPLLRKWMQQFTDAGETVLDPFCGSGSTGEAAMATGRKFIGIEIEPKYYEIACKRIEDAQRQVRMFP